MLTNVRSERVRSLRGLSRRVARERAGRFLAEGPQAVREALAEHDRRTAAGHPALVHELFAEPEAVRRYAELVDQAAAAGVTVTEAGHEVLSALSDTVHPQGLVAVCSLVDVPLDDVAARAPGLVAVLARVRDPGNAGTVLRAADAAGADAVVLTAESVDVHNSKCVRASAGSLFHLPVVAGPSVADAVTALKAAGCVVLAADARTDAEDLDDLLDAAATGAGPLARPTAWLFGNEAWGLTDDDLSLVDHVVRVPIRGSAESLNLAAAATVCLYSSARVRRAG
ncbi:MAG: TrmH family RNA methyltransferase [Actinomycetales bacterium]